MDLKIEIQILGGLILGSLATWIWIARRIAAGKPLVRYEPRNEVPWGGLAVLAIFFFYLVSQGIAIAAAIRFVGLEDGFDDLLTTTNGRTAFFASILVSSAATVVFGIVLACVGYGANATDLGFVGRRVGYDVVVGVLTFLAIGPLVYLTNIVLVYATGIEYDHTLHKLFDDRANLLTLSLGIAVAVVAAPVGEELLLRVFLQGWLEKLEVLWTGPGRRPPRHLINGEEPPADDIGEWQTASSDANSPHRESATTETAMPSGIAGLPLGSLPIWTSSIVFALMHLGQGPAPVALFVYALALGFIYQRTHRALPSIVAHFALNATSMAMLLLQQPPAG